MSEWGPWFSVGKYQLPAKGIIQASAAVSAMVFTWVNIVFPSWPNVWLFGVVSCYFVHVGADVFISDGADTTHHHSNCGAVWYNNSDGQTPCYCPGCGKSIIDEVPDHEG